MIKQQDKQKHNYIILLTRKTYSHNKTIFTYIMTQTVDISKL